MLVLGLKTQWKWNGVKSNHGGENYKRTISITYHLSFKIPQCFVWKRWTVTLERTDVYVTPYKVKTVLEMCLQFTHTRVTSHFSPPSMLNIKVHTLSTSLHGIRVVLRCLPSQQYVLMSVMSMITHRTSCTRSIICSQRPLHSHLLVLRVSFSVITRPTSCTRSIICSQGPVHPHLLVLRVSWSSLHHPPTSLVMLNVNYHSPPPPPPPILISAYKGIVSLVRAW